MILQATCTCEILLFNLSMSINVIHNLLKMNRGSNIYPHHIQTILMYLVCRFPEKHLYTKLLTLTCYFCFFVVFCLVYIYHGVFGERPYQLWAFMVAIISIVVYCIIQYTIKEKTVLLVMQFNFQCYINTLTTVHD